MNMWGMFLGGVNASMAVRSALDGSAPWTILCALIAVGCVVTSLRAARTQDKNQ